MKHIFTAFAILSRVGCTTYSASHKLTQVLPVPAKSADPEVFEAVLSRIDKNIETASIENYTIALPKFAYHEESEKSFRQRVRSARKDYAENKGKWNDFLFVGCDGCWPSKDFILDRNSQTLTIRIHEWEPGRKGTISMHTMRRVSGGWMRGTCDTIKPEQDVSAGRQPLDNFNPNDPPMTRRQDWSP